MNTEKHVINLVRDFSPKPYGRYTSEVAEGEEDTTGEKFRNSVLVPALKKYSSVHVDLTGYNRYAPSFLDEAFAGLISQKIFTYEEIKERLTYQHDDLPSIVSLITARIENAK